MVKNIFNFWKVILLDILGVVFMLAALATGWLPGPGGLPLFLIGLSLLAINHEWAKRYIETIKKYTDRLGDYIFVSSPKIQMLYDLLAPIVLSGGIYLLLLRNYWWHVSLGIFMSVTGLTFLLGNRKRWARLKATLKHKH